MKLAIFGGTFDPIHAGHLLMAETARVQAGLDRIIFLPTGRPPHKKGPQASPAQRLAMVRQAIRGNVFFQVSAWDIQQRRTVYTVEALAHFKTLHPDADLHFIVGTDSLRELPRWREGGALLGQCRFLAIERRSAPWTSLSRRLRSRVTRVVSPLCDISSREIRAQAARGQSIRYQVPEAVMAAIHKQRLYRRTGA